MSITNIIINDRYTIMQGVNGISLCQETWMVRDKQKTDKKQIDCNDNQKKMENPQK